MAATTNSSTLNEPRWLVVGVDGLIGGALVTALAASGRSVTGTTRRKDTTHAPLDLAADPGEWTLPPGDIAILCAAATRIADCEANPGLTARINVEAPRALAERLWARGCFVVFLSSSGVFDGVSELPTPATPPLATNAYGRQKVVAETALLAAARGRGLAIIRPTKVLSAATPLLSEWDTALASGHSITPHAWRSMAPLHRDAATAGILAIAAARESGIWHLSGAEDVNYAEFALRWAAVRGYPLALVVPQAGSNSAPRARLDMSATTRRFGIAAPTVATTISALARETK